MNNTNGKLDTPTVFDQLQLNKPFETVLEAIKACLQEESTLAEETDALSFQRDLLNYELTVKQNRLQQLRTYIQQEFVGITSCEVNGQS